MSFTIANLIQLDSLYITSTEGAGGIKYLSTVKGTDALELDAEGQDIIALDGTAYSQFSDIVDVPIDIEVPLMEVSMKDAINEVFQDYIDSPTPFTFVITGDPGTFTGTGKPRFPKPLEYSGEFFNNKVKQVKLKLYFTPS
jgi:hypothetical protein